VRELADRELARWTEDRAQLARLQPEHAPIAARHVDAGGGT
jgi:hypothetical protein